MRCHFWLLRRATRSIALAVGVAIVFAITGQLHAQDDVRSELAELRNQLIEQRQLIEKQSETIELQRQRIEQQAQRLDKLGGIVHSDAVLRPAMAPGSVRTPVPATVSPEQAELNHRIAEFLDGQQSEKASVGLRCGYSGGFFIGSPEGVKLGPDGVPFLLRIGSRIQMRHTAFDSDGPTSDENQFEFERTRLVFDGHAFTPDLKYYIALDADSDENERLDVIDYYVSYDFGHDVLGCDAGRLGIRAGKWKLPFNRTRQESGFALQFTDRTTANEFFDINRSLGVGLYGKYDLCGQTWNWETSISNGFRTEQFTAGRTVSEMDRNFGYAARIYTDLFGEWGSDGEPDLSYHECPAMRIGGGFAYTRLDRNDGLREFSALAAMDDSGLTPRMVNVLPAAVDEFNVFLYSISADFKYRGFSLLNELYLRQLNEFTGAPIGALFDYGSLVQAGYFICPKKVELLARWARVVGDSGTLGVSEHSSDELAAGVAWYIRGHNIKLVFDATHLNGAPLNASPLNIRAGDDGWLYRTQFQLVF